MDTNRIYYYNETPIHIVIDYHYEFRQGTLGEYYNDITIDDVKVDEWYYSKFLQKLFQYIIDNVHEYEFIKMI